MNASIWFQPPKLDDLRVQAYGTLVAHLDIRISEIGEGYLKATMPVDERTLQPMGLLHGGASVALAETLGSVAANLTIDSSRSACVGLEINANHLRPVRSGSVTGTATPAHIGRTTQVWQVEIHDEAARLICLSRITLAVLDRSD